MCFVGPYVNKESTKGGSSIEFSLIDKLGLLPVVVLDITAMLQDSGSHLHLLGVHHFLGVAMPPQAQTVDS